MDKPAGVQTEGSTIESVMRGVQTKGTMIDKVLRGVPPSVPQSPQVNASDLADVMAKADQVRRDGERDALSAIIERHTTQVRDAVDGMNRASQKAAEDTRRLTVMIVVLSAIIAVATVVAIVVAQ